MKLIVGSSSPFVNCAELRAAAANSAKIPQFDAPSLPGLRELAEFDVPLSTTLLVQLCAMAALALFGHRKKMDKIGTYTFRRASIAQTQTRKEIIMKIHQSKLDSIGRTVAITETAAASGGRKYGNFRSLRVVVLPSGMEPAQYRTVAHRGVSVLFAVEADGRCQGERSDYQRAMSCAVAAFAAA